MIVCQHVQQHHHHQLNYHLAIIYVVIHTIVIQCQCI